MADFLGAATPEEIIIGANMTTLTYHMSRTLGRGFEPGDEIIVTRMDHEGNVSPWLQLAEDRGLTVRFLPFDGRAGRSRRRRSKTLLTDRTRLVALNYASNLTGSINRVKALTALAKAGWRAHLCRCGAVRAARAGRRAGHRLRFPRLLGLQILRPAHGHPVGPARSDRRAQPYKCRCSSNGLPERFELGTPQIELMAGLTPRSAISRSARLPARPARAGKRSSPRSKPRSPTRRRLRCS